MKALLPAEPAPRDRHAEAAAVIPRTDELLVQVEAFSLYRVETFQLDAPRTGWRPGKVFAGRVLRPALEGSGPARGIRIVAHVDAGGWAEKAVVPLDRVAELPDQLVSSSAAALPL